jgi:hypothetical protein
VTSALEKLHKGVDKPQQHPLVQVGKMISADAITKAEFDEALSRYPALLKSISDAKKRRFIISCDDCAILIVRECLGLIVCIGVSEFSACLFERHVFFHY